MNVAATVNNMNNINDLNEFNELDEFDDIRIENVSKNIAQSKLNEEKFDTKPFKFEKILRRILLICSILLGAELLWLFLITPCLPLTTVDIKTIEGLTRATVLAYSGINSRSSYMSLDVDDITARLSVLPLVESANVIKQFPDSVTIVLKGRSATAMSLALIDGLSVPVFFDRNGVIFKIGKPKENNIADDIPLISGLYFENIGPGARLPTDLLPLLQNIADLKENSPQLLAAVSEIHINKKAYDGFDLILYPASANIPIRMGHQLTDENLRYMLLILDIVKERGLSTKDIDFRTGTASYIFKEQ
ncbi:MAG: FtsQ-type POTRA domain-containing protein [Termitinemataceae bacterium]|nr:MAG: FtsQ-type POTRA domain-containing protein [Termitinemataceae bacterium]